MIANAEELLAPDELRNTLCTIYREGDSYLTKCVNMSSAYSMLTFPCCWRGCPTCADCRELLKNLDWFYCYHGLRIKRENFTIETFNQGEE